MTAIDGNVAAARCRSCGRALHDRLIDLGPQPDPDRLLDPDDEADAPTAPIDLWLCGACGLVQLVGARPAGPYPRHGHYAGGSAESGPWPYARFRPGLGRDRIVVDVDVADARTGRAFAADGVTVHGFTRQSGLHGPADPWIEDRPFDEDAADALAARGGLAGVVIASHALPHADDPEALVRLIARILAPDGIVAIEFHHVLGLIEGQFDVLSHAHRSYLSVHALERLLARHGLVIDAAEQVDAFGGSVRVVARRADAASASTDLLLDAIRRAETSARVAEPAGYAAITDQVTRACSDLIAFLEHAREEDRRVGGYGAPARGTVLLNLARVDQTLLPFTVDRDPAKHGRAMPGSRIPIYPVSKLDARRPDDILVLPWPLADEIQQQLVNARNRGSRFVVAMPALRVL